MEKDIILAAAASCQNRDGILTLSSRKLQWSVQGEKSPTIETAISEIKNFFVGKQNASEAKFRIKYIDYNNQEVTHTIILKSQSPWEDLEIIKAKVKNKGQGRSAAPSPAPQGSAATSPIHYKSAAPSPASGGSSPAVWNNNLQQNKNGTTTNGRNGTRKMPTAKEINLRKNLLMRDKKLADQHRILVVEQKCIAEEEFWELRKNLLRDQDTRTSQQKGRSSTMPNLRPVTEEGGEAKINITPQLINEIFEEYPRVEAAYKANVPSKITEETFWRRYVHSKFNDRNRSATSVADDIFDKCWTETEDDLNQEREHGRKRLKISNLRDLNATKEDHMEIDFSPDVTMRAGQGKIISLLRRNNRHGERILEASCEKARRHTDQKKKKEAYIEDIVMEDLIIDESPGTFRLDITDQREYFASQAFEIDNDIEMVDAEQHQNSMESLNKFRESFKNWHPNLTKPLFPKRGGIPIPNSVTKECNVMIGEKQNRARESKPKIEHLPQKIEKEVNVIHLMGNEFLRHFWASVDSSVKEKIEKNRRMIEQLKSILTKIEQISKLQPPEDDNNKQTPNGVSLKGQKLDKEQRAVAINGKRLKVSSKASSSNSEQIIGNHLDGSDSEWKDSLIQAKQILNPLCKAINKALAYYNQGMNIVKSNNRQGPSTNQKSISSPDHHKAISRESKSISSSPVPRDVKQSQHQKTVKKARKSNNILGEHYTRIDNNDTTDPHVICKYCAKEFKRASSERLQDHLDKKCPKAPHDAKSQSKQIHRDLHIGNIQNISNGINGSSSQVLSENRIKTKRKV